MKAIDGTDTTITDATKYYALPTLSVDLDVDFLYSDVLDDVEGGAKSIGKTSDILSLIQGMAIVRIERDGLWMQAGFDNLRAYRIDQAARLGIPRSTVTMRRRIAEAWLEHRKLLAKVPIEGNISKLLFLNDALALHEDRKEVVDHFKKDSFDAFRIWARPDLVESEALPNIDAEFSKDGIFIEDKPVLLWPEEYPQTEKTWLGNVVVKAFRARQGGNLAHVVSVYDSGEVRAVDNFLKKLRASK